MHSAILIYLMAAQASPSGMSPERFSQWLESFKIAADTSATMVNWALTTIIATIAAIVSTSYWRPANLAPRLIYWLYFPGWLFLSLSIYFGDSISRRNIAAHFGKPEALPEIAIGLNHDYILQQRSLGIGLMIFGCWLLMYLWWWIHGAWNPANGKEN